jgi:hypothetical protein
MKLFFALAVAFASGVQAAHAQLGQQPATGSLRLLTSGTPATPPPTTVEGQPGTPATAPIIAPAPTPPPSPAAPAAPAPAAPAWSGPVSFSPVAVADLIAKVCRAAVHGDGGDLSVRAIQLGLGPASAPPEELSHALPPGAFTWRVPAVDGVVYLFGYGEEPLNCGATILRPLAEDGFKKVTALLQDPQIGFASDSTQVLQGEVRWERLKSVRGEYIDLMEYPPGVDRPGVLRADFLPG